MQTALPKTACRILLATMLQLSPDGIKVANLTSPIITLGLTPENHTAQTFEAQPVERSGFKEAIVLAIATETHPTSDPFAVSPSEGENEREIPADELFEHEVEKVMAALEFLGDDRLERLADAACLELNRRDSLEHAA